MMSSAAIRIEEASTTAGAKSLRNPTTLRVLVLNADGRPLSTYPPSIVSAQEAISALWRDRAIVIEEWEDAFFHSPSMTIAVPKIMMLREYAPISADPKFCRRNVLLRDRFRCCYCGKRFEANELSFDHVRPRSQGGKTEWSNIVSACLECNAIKADRPANYAGRKGVKGSLRPLKEPRRPTAAELLRAGMEFMPKDIIENFGSALYWSTELSP